MSGTMGIDQEAAEMNQSYDSPLSTCAVATVSAATATVFAVVLVVAAAVVDAVFLAAKRS